MTRGAVFCPIHEWAWSECSPDCGYLRAELRQIQIALEHYWQGWRKRQIYVTEVPY